MKTLPSMWRLTWEDVDPSRREFDAAAVLPLVEELEPAGRVPPAGTDWRLVSMWRDEMTAALVERYGAWVVGWPYTVDLEDVDGRGRMPVWRCVPPPVTTPEGTLAGIAGALIAWRELLVELAADRDGRFASVPAPGPDDGAEPRAWRVVRGYGQVAVYPEVVRPAHPYVRELSWAEVDPARRRFDPASVLAVVTSLPAATEVPASRADWRLNSMWLEAMTTSLTEHYGAWVVGWSWSVGETGGVVGAWCCSGHSITTPEATLAAVAASLVEWHEWLVELAERFARFLPLPGDLPNDLPAAADALEGWERAVAHLVTAVGDRTTYESGWQMCCRMALGWFLDAAGIETARREEILEETFDGRFEKWGEPSGPDLRAFAESLAHNVIRPR